MGFPIDWFYKDDDDERIDKVEENTKHIKPTYQKKQRKNNAKHLIPRRK